jgi:hypothetical protein
MKNVALRCSVGTACAAIAHPSIPDAGGGGVTNCGEEVNNIAAYYSNAGLLYV